MSSGSRGRGERLLEARSPGLDDPAADKPLQRAPGFAPGLALSLTSPQVRPRGWIDPTLREHDAVQGEIEPAVPAAIEAGPRRPRRRSPRRGGGREGPRLARPQARAPGAQ